MSDTSFTKYVPDAAMHSTTNAIRDVLERSPLAEDLGGKGCREHEGVLDPLTRPSGDDDCMEECDRAMPRMRRGTELDRRGLHRLKTATKSRWSGTR